MATSDSHGSCKVLIALDVARSIDLKAAEARLTSSQRTTFRHKSRVPAGAGMEPPLRVDWETRRLVIDGRAAETRVEVSIYEPGVVCLTWSLSTAGPLAERVPLAATLYDNAELAASSKALCEDVLAALGPAVERPRPLAQIEDYVFFQEPELDGDLAALPPETRQTLARILRAEEGGLSAQEVDDALAGAVSYGPREVCLVDWLGAILAGVDTEDERLVLELATVELLQLRILDGQLDAEIGEAYDLLARRRGLWAALTIQRSELEHVARMQTDDALLHEGIDNALKLFGDDYLARLYRTAAVRFHFEDWDASIQRKLGVLRSIYQSLADLASIRRSELLEWIIIVLIAVEIVLYFFPQR